MRSLSTVVLAILLNDSVILGRSCFACGVCLAVLHLRFVYRKKATDSILSVEPVAFNILFVSTIYLWMQISLISRIVRTCQTHCHPVQFFLVDLR